MIAMNPPARPWTRILTLLLLIFYVCWLCQDCIQYYSILFLPSMCVQLFHPGPAKFGVSWGVQRRGKSRQSSLKIEESAQRSKRAMPNVILIVADDLGIHDITSPFDVGTPNIDSIADNGVNFLNAYAGHATCAPSRAALYTGRFATRFGFEFTPTPKIFGMMLSQANRKNIHQPMFHHENLASIPHMRDMSVPVNETMIAEVLSHKFKYNTYMLGKWHLGETEDAVPMARGFDESLSFLVGASKYLQSSHKDVVNAVIKNSPIDDFLRWNLPFVVSHNNQPKFQPREYMTDFLSKEASKIIHTIHDTKNANPFFITVAYNAPHNPLQALHSDYDDPALANVTSHIQRVYYAMIKALDRGVGTILQALKDTDNWDNTVVIFTSDNGGASYIDIPDVNHPYRGWKGTFFEGGVRVPLFLQWPAIISSGIKVTESVSHVDIFPTVIAAVSLFAKEETTRATPNTDQPYPDSATAVDEGANDHAVESVEEGVQRSYPAISLSWCSGFEVFSKTMRSLVGLIVEPTLLTVHHLMSSMDGLFDRLLRSLQVTRTTTLGSGGGGGAADTLSDSGERMSCEVPKMNTYCKIWGAALGISWIGSEYCDFEKVDKKCIASTSSSSSASGRASQNSQNRDNKQDGSFPLDGINLLPYVVPQKNFLSMEKLFATSKETRNLHDRALFWRSGAYKAVLFTQWKMQISSRPDKVWFFNLRTDPLEKTNIAEQLNIHTVSDMRKFVSDEAKMKESSDATTMASKVFQLLEKLDAEQSPPLWPSLIEMPLLIDKTSNSQECPGDEYVYWAN